MKQSTFSAVMANSIKHLLQGYTEGIRFVAVLMVLLTMGIGQAWGANTGHTINYPYFYYYNDASWSNVSVIFGRSWTNDNYTKAGPMTLVPNTEKLYFRYIEDNWNDEYNQIAVLHGSWAWPSGEGKNIESRWDYATNKQHTDNIVWNHDMNYQEVHYWGGKSANSISREVPKYTTTLNIKVKESGQATYSNATLSDKPASTIKLTGTYLSSAGKTTRSEASWTTNSSCEYESVISGKVTPAYEGLNTDWTFDGWYVNSTKISSDKNYDFYQTANTTIEARFTKTVKYDVTWKVNGETYTAGSPSTSVAYNSKVTTLPTAPTIDCNGKVFVGWSNLEVTDGQKPSVLFTSASNAPAVTEATTYHAVFAEQEGFDGNVDFANRWNTTTNLTQYTESDPLTIGNVDLSFSQGSGATAPKYYTDRTSIRLYYGKTMKIDAGGATITKVTLHLNDKGTTDDLNQIFANNTSILEKDEYVTDCSWTGNANSVTIRIGERNDNNSTTSGHRKIQSLEVITTGGTVSYSNYTTSCIPIYTITYDLNGGSGSCAEAEVEKGSNYTICATPPTKEGYIFQGWEYNGTTYSEGATISNIQSDITLVAQWNPITYSVVFDANGGSGTMERQTFTYDDDAQSLTANTFTRDKYEFAGWNTKADGSGTSYDDEEEVKNLTTTNGATITLYAQWQKLYTVTFYNIGSLLETKTQEIVGGSIECPTITVPCEGYEFVGWSETAVTNGATSYTNVSCPITPTEDIELYAVYSQEAEGGGTTIQSIKTYQDGIYYLIDSFTDANSKTTYHSPKGTKAGKLSSVDLTNVVTIEDGIFTLDITSNSLTEDMKYTISKENDTYKIYNAETKAYVEPNASGTNFKNTDASGWSIDDENNRFMFYFDNRAFLYQDSYNSSGTKTYGRQFGNYSKSVAGTIINQQGKECYGSGYFFLVPATGGSTTTYTTTPDCCTPLDEITGLTFSAMTRSITVSVPDSYDNTNVDGYIFNLYNAVTGGVATTYDTNDKNEKSYTFTGLNPKTEYYFTIIAKGSGAYCNSEETSPRESYTTLPQYTVTWKPAGGHWNDNYSDKVDTYDYQATITQPANPERKGYTFNGWDKTPATIMPAEDLTYTAQWNIETYIITYENLNGATHTNPEEYTVETAAITLTDPTERAGYVFAGWYSDANYKTKVTQIPQGSTGDITLYAKWLEIFTITWMVNGEVSSTTEVVEGEPITPPASPDPGDYCGQVFAGWTDAEIAKTSVAAPTLYPTPNPFPKASADAIFYAVFADYITD